MKEVKPYNNTKNKKEQVTKMFNNIAYRYDFLNHSLSLGMDNVWRKLAIKKIDNNPQRILDIATGTGDFAITAAKYTDAHITGIDISDGMLKIGRKKISKKKLNNRITLNNADCESLPFSDNSFDVVTAGFGVRNFENLNKGLSEMFRVLKKNGKVIILEPSSPKFFPLKQIYSLYFHYILPKIGALISRDKSAYKYLPESVNQFPSGKKFIDEMKNVNFKDFKFNPLSLGIISLYTAIK